MRAVEPGVVRPPALPPFRPHGLSGWHLAALTAVALSAGCAEMRWGKPGVDSAKVEEDLAQCRGEARLQASRESVPRSPGSPQAIRMDAAGRPIVAPPASRGTDTLVLEQDLTSACMRGKGYELAPR